MPGRALDVTDAEAVRATLDAVRPWAVFHAAGVRSPEDGERDRARCRLLHARAPALIGAACADRGIRLVQLSSSLVLSGPGPCDESAPIRPRGVLGEAQADGERETSRVHPEALVVRCGLVLGLDRFDDPLSIGLAALEQRRPWRVPKDVPVVFAELLVDATLDLLIDGETGVRHLAHRRTLLDLARSAARFAGLDAAGVAPGVGADDPLLSSARGNVLRSCAAVLRERVSLLSGSRRAVRPKLELT
jgi:dTDP-4-dehydrorhamnose reductase